MPVRKAVDPLMVQIIENNVILKGLVTDLTNVAEKQETNHLVALALQQHDTINRVDKMWGLLTQLRLLLVIPALVALVGSVMAILFMTHAIWHWPG